jgi:hypothetical protein
VRFRTFPLVAVPIYCRRKLCYATAVRVPLLYNVNNYTGRHQLPPWNNFDKFSLGIGSQTRMCKWNVYVTLRLGDTKWYLSWMAEKRNSRLAERFVMLFLYIYLFSSLKPLEKHCLNLSHTGKACSTLFKVPLICPPEICRSDVMLVWSNVSVINCHCDQMSVRSNYAVINSGRDKMSVRSFVGVIKCQW